MTRVDKSRQARLAAAALAVTLGGGLSLGTLSTAAAADPDATDFEGINLSGTGTIVVKTNFIGIRLPFTGETGRNLPVAIGFAIVIGAFAAFIVRARKANAGSNAVPI